MSKAAMASIGRIWSFGLAVMVAIGVSPAWAEDGEIRELRKEVEQLRRELKLAHETPEEREEREWSERLARDLEFAAASRAAAVEFEQKVQKEYEKIQADLAEERAISDERTKADLAWERTMEELRQFGSKQGQDENGGKKEEQLESAAISGGSQ